MYTNVTVKMRNTATAVSWANYVTRRAMLFYPPRSDALFSNYFEDLLTKI